MIPPRHKRTEKRKPPEEREHCRCRDCLRIWLPEVLKAEDVAAVFGLESASAARRLMRSGALGPIFKIGRRWFIRRDALLKTIESREGYPLADREPLPWEKHLRRGARRPQGS